MEQEESTQMDTLRVRVHNLTDVLHKMDPKKPGKASQQLSFSVRDVKLAMDSIKTIAVPGAGPSSGVRGPGHVPHHLLSQDDDDEIDIIGK